MIPDSSADALADDERRWMLLDRYLTGEVDAGEADAIRRWLDADPRHSAMLDELRTIRSVGSNPVPSRSLDVAWKRLRFQIGRPAPDPSTDALPETVAHSPVASRHSVWYQVLRVAAVAAVIMAIGTLAWRRSGLPSGSGAEGTMADARHSSRTFASPRGQRAVLRLVDGTQVVLAPDSRLIVPSTFGVTHRDVELDGEAMFDATHDSIKPFVVHARDAVVKDLGTRFVVRGFASDSAVRVVVTLGRVQLRSRGAPDGSGALLEQGMLAQIDGAGATSVRTDVDTTRYVSWVTGSLVFVGTPFRDVARELARWYDIDIQLPDPKLAARRLTATIDDQPLAQLLDQLSISLGAHVTRTGRTVTFTPARLRPTRHGDSVPESDFEGGLP